MKTTLSYLVATVLCCAILFPSCSKEICENSCAFRDDGECDDGGSGSVEPALCEYGRDCNDCGSRKRK